MIGRTLEPDPAHPTGHQWYAELLTFLGEHDAAFAKLEEAFATHDRGMVYVRVNPRFDPLRDDPRFASLVARMRFPAQERRR